MKLCKTAGFKEAINEIESYIKSPEKYATIFEASKGDVSDPNEEFDKLRSTSDDPAEPSTTTDTTTSPAANTTTTNVSSSGSSTAVVAATPKKATPGRKQKLEPKTSVSATKVVVPRANSSAVKRSAAVEASPVDSTPKAKRPRVSSTPRRSSATNHSTPQVRESANRLVDQIN